MFVCAWLDICVTCTTTHILARGSDFNVGNFQFGQENRDSDDVTPHPPLKKFGRNGHGIGIHRQWQTRNDSLTIREWHSPNGKGNDQR